MTALTITDGLRRTPRPGLLPVTAATRDLIVGWLTQRAEQQATRSRDFGRGYAHAVQTLADAPTCPTGTDDRARRGDRQAAPEPDCPECRRLDGAHADTCTHAGGAGA